MELEMEATIVYEKTLDALSQYKIVCSEGSSRSSKTWSNLQIFINMALAREFESILIARLKLTWLKSTLLKDFDTITRRHNIPITPEFNLNRPEQTYYINGVEFNFMGLDQPQRSHGQKQDIAWLNETMEIPKNVFEQVELRTTKKILLDYNPSDDSHWVFPLQLRDDVGVVKSTFRDNPFLEQPIVDKILSYEPTAENIERKTADAYMWSVYGLGEKAKLEGLIFPYWDTKAIPEGAKSLGLGLDYGYTKDPTAVVEVFIHNNELYFDELVYETGLDNNMIADRLRSLNIDNTYEITADSAEPKSTDEIKKRGFRIRGVEKGADSINFGIDILKQYVCHITPRSINLDKEVRRYKWAEDRNGNLLRDSRGRPVPVGDFNHAIDALRYRCMEILRLKTTIKLHPAGILG